MKTNMKALCLSMVAFLLIGSYNRLSAQTHYQSSTTKTVVKGTSTLHDWEMSSSKGQTKSTFSFSGAQVTGISALSFTVQAESLKSDKSGLDKNAYKALNTGKHANIAFTMTSGTITATGNNTFQIKATGQLVIAGTSKLTSITATGQLNPTDKSITVNGSTTFNMSEYKVTPPTVMLGTIKTGDEVTIEYQVKLTP